MTWPKRRLCIIHSYWPPTYCTVCFRFTPIWRPHNLRILIVWVRQESRGKIMTLRPHVQPLTSGQCLGTLCFCFHQGIPKNVEFISITLLLQGIIATYGSVHAFADGTHRPPVSWAQAAIRQCSSPSIGVLDRLPQPHPYTGGKYLSHCIATRGSWLVQ